MTNFQFDMIIFFGCVFMSGFLFMVYALMAISQKEDDNINRMEHIYKDDNHGV